MCNFKGTAPEISCCTQKGTILKPYFSVYILQLIIVFIFKKKLFEYSIKHSNITTEK